MVRKRPTDMRHVSGEIHAFSTYRSLLNLILYVNSNVFGIDIFYFLIFTFLTYLLKSPLEKH